MVGSMVWPSMRSTSLKAMVPVSVRLASRRDGFEYRAGQVRGRHDRIVIGAGDGDLDNAIDGTAIRPSSSVMVNCSVLISSLARYSTAEAATL